MASFRSCLSNVRKTKARHFKAVIFCQYPSTTWTELEGHKRLPNFGRGGILYLMKTHNWRIHAFGTKSCFWKGLSMSPLVSTFQWNKSFWRCHWQTLWHKNMVKKLRIVTQFSTWNPWATARGQPVKRECKYIAKPKFKENHKKKGKPKTKTKKKRLWRSKRSYSTFIEN